MWNNTGISYLHYLYINTYEATRKPKKQVKLCLHAQHKSPKPASNQNQPDFEIAIEFRRQCLLQILNFIYIEQC